MAIGMVVAYFNNQSLHVMNGATPHTVLAPPCTPCALIVFTILRAPLGVISGAILGLPWARGPLGLVTNTTWGSHQVGGLN